MGIVWETYHKRVPVLGVPENPTEKSAGELLGGSFHFLEVLTNHAFCPLGRVSLVISPAYNALN